MLPSEVTVRSATPICDVCVASAVAYSLKSAIEARDFVGLLGAAQAGLSAFNERLSESETADEAPDDELDACINAAFAEAACGDTFPRASEPDTKAGAAWSLSREWRGYQAHKDTYEDWWCELECSERATVDAVARRYTSIGALEEWHISQHYPFDVGTVPMTGGLYAELIRRLRLMTRAQFDALVSSPVKVRSAFVDDYCDRTSQVLRLFMLIPRNRPKGPMNETDDLWHPRIYIYINNLHK
jgi:hypothetical protein